MSSNQNRALLACCLLHTLPPTWLAELSPELAEPQSRPAAVLQIAEAAGRIWVATDLGIDVLDGNSGRLLFELEADCEASTGRIQLLTPLSEQQLLLSSDRGAAVLTNLAESPADLICLPVFGGGRRTDPIFAVRPLAPSHWLVATRRGGWSELWQDEEGRYRLVDSGRRFGAWYGASSNGEQLLLGDLDGTLAAYARERGGRSVLFDDGALWRRRLDAPVLALEQAALPGKGAHLVATGERLLLIDARGVQEIRDASGGAVHAQVLTSQGQLGVLIGCADGRIFLHNQQGLAFLSQAPGSVTALHAGEQLLWVGARRGGIWVMPLPPEPPPVTVQAEGAGSPRLL